MGMVGYGWLQRAFLLFASVESHHRKAYLTRASVWTSRPRILLIEINIASERLTMILRRTNKISELSDTVIVNGRDLCKVQYET